MGRAGKDDDDDAVPSFPSIWFVRDAKLSPEMRKFLIEQAKVIFRKKKAEIEAPSVIRITKQPRPTKKK